ncbi:MULTISPECIES: pyruvate dehydrogenase complex E1 component subunit beta [Sphingobium]|uniref:Pyruvate dehydrogenase E1 component subunit beta n=2 Tax=Sphingobium fuliginis (strain ATCC 27551) TaxID=336203 RepID=A0ABQ1F0P4_SPHSA|nr:MULTISPECIES: pyruvate dehydrogenase complex E1 component subunit beta [Sphingobium]AJR25139.1 pyruvate dehydrogenase [Sphingobium sp. YBL2]PNP98206.1 pyruvate dehydrogenase complex E1 component subunit beta [Sphingobium sp. SA916]QDC36713.1 pyruvate dehydrogenase complex E1 component subunit beta [Sphingobium fuliginis ATCC 27551]RYL97493.1 pyruvate dehydrogenase complex E1 component subunit beta [Sphingobium fuliginis]WDA37404.1 pyruvate dehydrogenase complex E1 component subunit beta [Sp
MGIEIKMPALSPTMEEGTLAKWLVKEGDEVRSGDILAEIETDKATMEFEAVDEGKIGQIMVAEGTEGVKVGTVIATMAADGAGEGGETAQAPKAAESAPPAAPEAAPAPRKAESGTSKLATEAKATVKDPALPEGTEYIKTTVREALRDAMAEEMRRDERVFVMGEEVAEYQGAYKVTQGLLEEFGDRRVIDTPITEYGFAGIGAGAAMGGLKPIVEFMTFNFAMQAIDHIINSAAKTNYMSGGQMRCPIVFRGPNGAASRVAAQHSQNYGPWYASVPGLIVIAPYDSADAKGLLKAAIRSDDPVVFLENELVYGRSFDVPKVDDYVLPIGKARIVREGKDVTLVSYSIGVGVALEAAEALAGEGIDAEVIDLRTLRPLDTATVLESLKKTNRLVVVEEGWPVCSIASEIAAVVMEQGFDDLDAPVLRVTNEDVPLPYAANLEKAALIDAARVVAAAKKVCYR